MLMLLVIWTYDLNCDSTVSFSCIATKWNWMNFIILLK